MADAVIDWGGTKPSITYGLEGNRVKISIGSLGGWAYRNLIILREKKTKIKRKRTLGRF